MNYQHWTMRDDDGRRTLMPTIVVLGVTVVIVVAFFLVLAQRDRGGPSVAGFDTADVTVAPTTEAPLPLPPAVGAQDIPSGNLVSPDVSPDLGEAAPVETDPATSDPPVTEIPPLIDDPVGVISSDASAALDSLASDLLASDATQPVRKFGGTYAMLIVGGTARLVEWDGQQWYELQTVTTPAPAGAVTATDVTGDGTPDFVITLEDAARSGGVFNDTGTRWDWLPFAARTGSTSFVEGLEESSGQLRSQVADTTGRPETVDWRWDGFEFSIR